MLFNHRYFPGFKRWGRGVILCWRPYYSPSIMWSRLCSHFPLIIQTHLFPIFRPYPGTWRCHALPMPSTMCPEHQTGLRHRRLHLRLRVSYEDGSVSYTRSFPDRQLQRALPMPRCVSDGVRACLCCEQETWVPERKDVHVCMWDAKGRL